MEPLKKIQVEGFAMFAEPELLFGNLDELCCVSQNTVNIEGYVMCLYTNLVQEQHDNGICSYVNMHSSHTVTVQ